MRELVAFVFCACAVAACASSDCPSGQTRCGGTCLDLNDDNANCGACGTQCGPGTSCSQGSCSITCAAADATCTDASGNTFCASLASDDANCGACGHACGAGTACAAGQCATTCQPDESRCVDSNGAPYCAKLASDNANCGTCGTACAPGETCSGSVCTKICLANEMLCGSACSDLLTDNANCGSCGNPCPDGTMCAGGVCGTTCGSNLADCSGTCRDLQDDPTNCGTCGATCSFPNAAAYCLGGMCGLGECANDYDDCDGNTANGCETNVKTNVDDCGACGVACGTPANGTATCTGGSCAVASCAPNTGDCNGLFSDGCEDDLLTDSSNCGACGNACAVGATCTNGACSGGGTLTQIFDSLSAQSGASSRNAGGDSCGTQIHVTVTTTIHAIAVKNTMSSASSIKFLIFDASTESPLLVTTAKAFTDTTDSWKQSDTLTYTLQAGQNYDIGGIADVAGTWDYDVTMETTSAMSSVVQNPNWSNFTTPTEGTRGGADCGIRLYQ